VGNLQIQTLHEIVSNKEIKKIQDSILDGSYRHCEESLCAWLLDHRPEKQTWRHETPLRRLRHIRLGVDDSCNLSCPSCRLEKIFEKRGTRMRSRIKIIKKVIDFLTDVDHDITIHIGSDGDPFASLVYRYFIQHCPKKSNIHFSIQTNGLLLKKMYHKNQWLFEQLNTLGLSIDGSNKDTYEKLRRGGRFDNLCSNLDFIKSIRHKHNFELIYHCVVQKDNFMDMVKYINFAKGFGADKIWFNRIVDWKTYKNFTDVDVVHIDNPDHESFKRVLSEVKIISERDNDADIEFPTLDVV